MSTGLTLNVGDTVTISATGTVTYTFGGPLVSPDGIGPTTAADYGLAPPPVSGTSRISPIGTGPWQFVGSGPTIITASTPGLLRLAVNDSLYSDNTGGFTVPITPNP